MEFAHLHTHTVYSIKDATAQPSDYVRVIHEYNNSQDEHKIIGLAICEHGNIFSIVPHHNACQKPDVNGNKIKCLYGNEVYHVDDLVNTDKSLSKNRYHMPLIPMNDEGLKNFMKITTHGGLNKYKSKTKDFQLTTIEYIKQHGKGVIGLSGCMGGKIGRLIVDGEYEKAKEFAIEMSNHLEHFYLEIQPHDTLPEQMLINNALLLMNKETGIPLVITTDSHYPTKEDKKYHDIMKEIDHSKPFTTESHLWTVHELVDWCNRFNIPMEAITNTAEIAKMCTADIKPKDPRGLMPDYPCPKGYTEDSYLQKLVDEGFKKRIAENKHIRRHFRTYFSRIQYEMDVITQMGFSAYFLILWDWFLWCKENKILLGPGRGSAAGLI